MTEVWWISLIKAFVIVNLVMLAFAYTTWLERKLLGRMQNRYGPNRAGPFGLLQPIADLVVLDTDRRLGKLEHSQSRAAGCIQRH